MKLNDITKLSLIWGLPVDFEGLKNKFLLVPEMRPYLLGLSLCEELKTHGYPYVYVTDNMLGYLFFKGKIKETLLFYLERTADEIKGISGSLYVTLLSRLHQVPVYFRPGKRLAAVNDKHAGTLDGRAFVEDEKSVIWPEEEIIKFKEV